MQLLRSENHAALIANSRPETAGVGGSTPSPGHHHSDNLPGPPTQPHGNPYPEGVPSVAGVPFVIVWQYNSGHSRRGLAQNFPTRRVEPYEYELLKSQSSQRSAPSSP